MTKRKFTLPTEFPAEYVDADGNKMVVLGMSHAENFPLIGFNEDGKAMSWTQKGKHYIVTDPSSLDLHDIPKRITTWFNVYKGGGTCSFNSMEDADFFGSNGRLCVWCIESDEDGGNPKFVEENNETP